MKVGFSKVDITPPVGTPLCGQLISLPARGVESPLYATAMLLDDGDTCVVLVSCDVLMISNDLARSICRKAASSAGIPEENIVIAATHTHSGPYTVDLFGMKTGNRYAADLQKKTVDAIRQARLNSETGSLFVASGQIEGYAFNRRFIMSDGTVETHPLKNDPHIVKPEGPDSKDIIVWHARDKNDKLRGAAVNFACHGTVMERSNDMISSDFPGKVAGHISSELGPGVTALFLQGACGNICQVNPLDSTRHEVGPEWMRTMGSAIGGRALELIKESSVPVTGKLRLARATVEIPRRRIDPDLVKWAGRPEMAPTKVPELSDYGVESYGSIEWPTVSLQELFKTQFWAHFYKNEIQTLEKLHTDQPFLQLTITVIAQDNWACVAIPCELFIEWSDRIRAGSPFDVTAVVELANGWNGYIPTRRAFERSGGYETKEVTSTMLVPEAGDIVCDAVMPMLQKIHRMN